MYKSIEISAGVSLFHPKGGSFFISRCQYKSTPGVVIHKFAPTE